jgi:hypothetical protein
MRQTRIGELKTPFTIGDFLERVVPGFILVVALHQILFPTSPPKVYGLDGVMLAILVLAVSYPLGVGLNFLARFVRPANQRSASDPATDPRLRHIKDSFEAFFGILADDQAWRYCYGIVVKHGYSVNVQLFAQLDIFCRSMMAGSGIVVFVSIASRVLSPGRWDTVSFAATVSVSAASFVIFLFSARTYSRAFVGAIYEGFYSWLCESKSKAMVPNAVP